MRAPEPTHDRVQAHRYQWLADASTMVQPANANAGVSHMLLCTIREKNARTI